MSEISKCCKAAMKEVEFEEKTYSICSECQKLYVDGVLHKFEMAKEELIHEIDMTGKVGFNNPSEIPNSSKTEEEELSECCEDHFHKCSCPDHKCPCAAPESPKPSLPNPPLDWEKAFCKKFCDISNKEKKHKCVTWGDDCEEDLEPQKEFMKFFLEKARNEERKRCAEIVGDHIFIVQCDEFECQKNIYAELRSLKQKILNPNQKSE